MTPKQKAAMQMALEALTFAYYEDKDYNDDCQQKVNKAREKLREALAEPKEKYQYGTPLLDAMTGKTEQPANVAAVNTSSERVDKTAKNVHEQPAQPSKPWVGLTEEEVDECYYWKGRQWTTDELVRHVEAKLREKNNG